MKNINSLSENKKNETLSFALLGFDAIIGFILTSLGFRFLSYSNPSYHQTGLILLLLDVIIIYLFFQVLMGSKTALSINIVLGILIVPLIFPLMLIGTTS